MGTRFFRGMIKMLGTEIVMNLIYSDVMNW